MRTLTTTALAVTLTGAGLVTVAGQEPASRLALNIMALSTTTDVAELRLLDARVDALVRTNALVLASQQPDVSLSGRVHETFKQYHAGVPVYGGGISRQLANTGLTVSIFGTIHQGIDLDMTPQLAQHEALALVEQRAGAGPATDDPLTLVIVPTPFDTYVLAYRATMRDFRTYFLDAHSGAIVHVENEVDEQGAIVGIGVGVNNDRKKVSASPAGGGFQTYDRLRPAEIVTLDLRYDEVRADRLIGTPEMKGVPWRPSDVASDADNEWDDPAVVDGHVNMGFTYDYLVARHGWNGIDGRNGRILTMVNIGRDDANAFFIPPPYGPEGTGVIVFGEERDGTPIVSADTVAHESMHGVTYHSVKQRTGDGLLNTVWYIHGPSSFTLDGVSRRFLCGQRLQYPEGALTDRWFRFACQDGRFLLYANDGGAVNEAYSDIIGTSVEFSLHDPGAGSLRADYTMGEDTGQTLRSLENPRSITLGDDSSIPYPDAYGRLVQFLIGVLEDNNQTFFSNLGSVDGQTITRLPAFLYSGEHWNSTILSHAFYLAIEGGRNDTTGRTVQGVGGANRHDVERAFFRAMTDLMPASTNIPMAADVIRQSAVDLFGTGSTTYRAVDQALRAVGL
jgi:bacillolysin